MKTITAMRYNFFDFLDSLGIAWKYAINGLIGGIVWCLYKKTKFVEALRQIIIGSIVAGYFTPVIVSKTSMNMSYVGFTSFLVGMTGMVVIDSLYKYVAANIKKWKQVLFILFSRK